MDIQFSESVRALAKAPDKKENGPIGPEVSALAHEKNAAKKALNASILESTINVTAADSPLSLVLKTALEGINEALGSNTAIQEAYDSGVDVSPEATADRIVSLSTAFFSAYQEQNPDKSVADFIDVISGGIDQGFQEARDILEGLQVLDGEIAENINTTYDLVQAGLQSFLESFSNTET